MFPTKFQRVDSTGVYFPIPSCVQQCDKESTDINTIIKRYGRDCVCAACAANPKQPISEELAMLSAEDFTSMMNKTAQIQSQFEELPADVRKRFGHNPANMLEFIQDPANREEGEKLGLLKKRDYQSVVGNDGNNSISTGVDMVGNVSGETNNQTTEEVNTGNLSE